MAADGVTVHVTSAANTLADVFTFGNKINVDVELFGSLSLTADMRAELNIRASAVGVPARI